MRLEDWKREQMKDWRFRFWSVVLWPEFRWVGFKIRFRIWLKRRLGFEEGVMNTYEIGTMVKRLMNHLPDQNNGADWDAARAKLDPATLRGINTVRIDAEKFLRRLYAERG